MLILQAIEYWLYKKFFKTKKLKEKKSIIISLEGIDKTGKSLLASEYKDKFIVIKEPEYYSDIIKIYYKLSKRDVYDMFLISRFNTMEKIVAMEKNNESNIIIFDRFIDSTLVYQVLYQKLDTIREFIRKTEKFIFRSYNFYPDLTIIFLKDKIKEGSDIFEEDIEMQKKLQEYYKMLGILYKFLGIKRNIKYVKSIQEAREIIEEFLNKNRKGIEGRE